MIPYLYTADNPNASLRTNGKRGWYYPTRKGGLAKIRVIVLHTTENTPTLESAEAVASWQRTVAAVPSSYHKIIDSDSVVVTLPDAATSFSVRRYNSISLNLSFAIYARLWGSYPVWERSALNLAAIEVANWCKEYDIPPKLLTKNKVDKGDKGITFHSRLDSYRRSDPGSKFPIKKFLKLVKAILEGEGNTKMFSIKDRDRLKEIESMIKDIHKALGGANMRSVDYDLRNIRISQRAIGKAAGAKVWDGEGDPPLDGSQVIS